MRLPLGVPGGGELENLALHALIRLAFSSNGGMLYPPKKGGHFFTSRSPKKFGVPKIGWRVCFQLFQLHSFLSPDLHLHFLRVNKFGDCFAEPDLYRVEILEPIRKVRSFGGF